MRKLICLFICMYFVSCSSSEHPVLYESRAVPEKGWSLDDPVRFELNIADTMQLYDIHITLRHNTDYEWMNVFLFLKTYYPNQEFSRDTLECFLSDETGRWFGRGSSSVKDCIMLFKSEVRFPQEGRYVFEFIHGMRTRSLENIMDVGMKIVPTR